MRTRIVKMTFNSIFFSLCLILWTTTSFAFSIDWIRQLGTAENDDNYGVSADGLGNVYITGVTLGELGESNAGNGDAFLSKYNDSGTLLWTEQLGTSSGDLGLAVSADGLGNVYISGRTAGDLGGPQAGGVFDFDAFVSKYDDSGTLIWTEQFGTFSYDTSWGISADGLGNIYITGETLGIHSQNSFFNTFSVDAFVRKYDEAGNLLWAEQHGTTSDDRSFDVSADGLGNVYITGYTEGNFDDPNLQGGNGIFLSKYDDAGNLLWNEQVEHGRGYGVSADGLGNVYISGLTFGIGVDAFLRKYDSAGTLLWTQEIENVASDMFDRARVDVSADLFGNVYISGTTFQRTPYVPPSVFVHKYDGAGNLIMTEQFGTDTIETISGVSVDGLGNVYFSGTTSGDLGGTNAGRRDSFLVKFSETTIPEPSTFVMGMLAAVGITMRRRV